MKKTGISLVSIFIVLILHSLVFTANSQVNNSNSDFIKSEVFSEEQQTKDETSSNENKIPVIEIYKSEISCNEFIWSPDSKNFL